MKTSTRKNFWKNVYGVLLLACRWVDAQIICPLRGFGCFRTRPAFILGESKLGMAKPEGSVLVFAPARLCALLGDLRTLGLRKTLRACLPAFLPAQTSKRNRMRVFGLVGLVYLLGFIARRKVYNELGERVGVTGSFWFLHRAEDTESFYLPQEGGRKMNFQSETLPNNGRESEFKKWLLPCIQSKTAL